VICVLCQARPLEQWPLLLAKKLDSFAMRQAGLVWSLVSGVQGE